jgi:hypothetical protein
MHKIANYHITDENCLEIITYHTYRNQKKLFFHANQTIH